MPVRSNSPCDRALQVIEAALQSGSIKLNGAIGNAQHYAETDALYLNKLLAALAKGIAETDAT